MVGESGVNARERMFVVVVTSGRQDGTLHFKSNGLLKFGLLGSVFTPSGLLCFAFGFGDQQHVVEKIDIQLELLFLCPR